MRYAVLKKKVSESCVSRMKHVLDRLATSCTGSFSYYIPTVKETS